MPEEIKEKIYEFLKENKGRELSIIKLKNEMGKAGMSYCYHTVLKWCAILNAEPENNIRIKDYGSIKIISYVEDEDD